MAEEVEGRRTRYTHAWHHLWMPVDAGRTAERGPRLAYGHLAPSGIPATLPSVIPAIPLCHSRSFKRESSPSPLPSPRPSLGGRGGTTV